MVGELSSGNRKPGRFTADEPENPRGINAYEFLYRVTSPTLPPLETEGVAWHPYQHSLPPKEAGAPGVTGIGRITTTRKRIEGLFNKSPDRAVRCASRLRTPDCKVPGLLFTEFGYLARGYGSRPVARKRNLVAHTEKERASLFTSALRKALKYKAKWMVLYHAAELDPRHFPPPDRDDYGLFSVDGSVRGTRPYGKGPKPNFANPQRRRAFCDGIYNFALEKRYPTGDAGC